MMRGVHKGTVSGMEQLYNCVLWCVWKCIVVYWCVYISVLECTCILMYTGGYLGKHLPKRAKSIK